MANMQVDKKLIRDLANLLDETNLTEIEVEDGDRRVRVARGGGGVTVAAPVAAPAPAAAQAAAPTAQPAAEEDLTKHPGAVLSPMVGTAYVSPEPGAAPFVTEGTQVQEGQTLLIVEAMKVMNPIPAPRSGTIKTIAVGDKTPIEYGELLMIIE
jgi:acetyl-CoA carboxylase biotin carboxyl carrier protein